MDLLNRKIVLQDKRWLWLDYDKGISIILVGYGHCLAVLTNQIPDLEDFFLLNYIGLFFYGFRMPLFFIVSGMLVGRSLHKKGLTKYLFTRADLLYAMMVWGIIEITLRLLSGAYEPESSNLLTRYLQLLLNPRETGHFWYLNALACIGIVYAFLKDKIKLTAKLQLAVGAVLYGISAYIEIKDVEAGFLTDICKYYFFFALGDVVSVPLLDDANRQKLSRWKLFIPLAVIFLVIQYYCTEINLQHNEYGYRFVEEKMPFLFLIEALVGCAASMSFSFLLQKYRVFTWIRIIGYHSLYIYLMQIIVMSTSRIVIQNVFHVTNTPLLVLLVWVSGTLLPIIVYNLLCGRLHMWWLFTLINPNRIKKIQYQPAVTKF